jgi:hypothetical protein
MKDIQNGTGVFISPVHSKLGPTFPFVLKLLGTRLVRSSKMNRREIK